jgi:hypothetical protein
MYFQRVYPIDFWHTTIIKPSIIVINLDKHYMPRSHWVAVCFSDCGYSEYFDSYGLPPYRLEISNYMQRHSISWGFNRHILQGLTSNICGHYCCLYALHRAKGHSMTTFVSMFSSAATTATIKALCACSALISESVQSAASWRRRSSRASRSYKIKLLSLTVISQSCLT